VPGPGGETVQVAKSQKPYDEKIIGIISDGSSGFKIQSYMGMNGGDHPGKPLVLTGRFPVKVTLENGPIKRGDYLTSSSKPGYAMRATEPGPTVGVALDDFDGSAGGEGKVLCYVDIGERNIASVVRKLEAKSVELERENRELKGQLSALDDVRKMKADLVNLQMRLDRMERQGGKKGPKLTNLENDMGGGR
jgi:hypothetical protein